MVNRNIDRPIGDAFEILPGADATFTFSQDGREVADPQIGELSPEAQANMQMVEETFRRLTGQEPTTRE